VLLKLVKLVFCSNCFIAFDGPQLCVGMLYYICLSQTNVSIYFLDIVELRHIVGDELIGKLVKSTGNESDQRAMRDCFTALMTCPNDVVQQQLTALIERSCG